MPEDTPSIQMKTYKVNPQVCTAGSLVSIGEGDKARTYVVKDDLTVDIPGSLSPNDLPERVFPGVGKK